VVPVKEDGTELLIIVRAVEERSSASVASQQPLSIHACCATPQVNTAFANVRKVSRIVNIASMRFIVYVLIYQFIYLIFYVLSFYLLYIF
jgi:hypothetical protein